MYYPQKNKSQKSSYTKTKAVDAKHWDHSGFDQLEQEAKSFQNGKSNKFSKYPNKNHKRGVEATLMSDTNSSFTIDKDVSPIATKWLHDKFDETLSLSVIEAEEENVKKDQRKSRGEKKPDRQLYNVRNKQGTSGNNTKEEKIRGANGNVEESLQAIEDDKSFISNVSTAMSDRLKNCEDESLTRNDIINESLKEKRQSLTNKEAVNNDEANKTVEITIYDKDDMVTVRIYEDEEDFEDILEQMCVTNKITGRIALYFKINLLQYLQSLRKSPKKTLDTCLEKLLDENYSLILSELRSEEQQQDSILEGLDDESRQDFV